MNTSTRQIECTIPILPVRDLARCVAFYTGPLGFKLLFEAQSFFRDIATHDRLRGRRRCRRGRWRVWGISLYGFCYWTAGHALRVPGRIRRVWYQQGSGSHAGIVRSLVADLRKWAQMHMAMFTDLG